MSFLLVSSNVDSWVLFPTLSLFFLSQGPLTNHGWETQRKQHQVDKEWRSEEAEHIKSVLYFFFCFSLSYPSIHWFGHHHWITPLPFPLTMYLFLSALSWLVTSEYMTCWFIVKLCQCTPAAVEINYSDPVVMRLEDVRLCVCEHTVRWRMIVSCHSKQIVLPLLKMGSCTPFWQSSGGPGAWFLYRAHDFMKQETKVKQMRNKWSGGQMKRGLCMH